MTDSPLISVIIPVYKVESYLSSCLESVLAQSYTNLQIILVDDGSPDGCGVLCDRWAEKDPRITVIHKENGGLSSARNAGLEIATGAYVMFVDSDDILSDQLCQVLYQTLDGADIAICDPVHIFPDTPWEYAFSQVRTQLDPESAICQMWYQTAFLPSAWGKLFRRELFARRRFTVGRLYEDIDVMHEVFYDAKSIAYTPARLYGYQHREDSITTKAFSKRDLDILMIANKLLAFAADKPALQSAARAYATTAALRVYLNAPKELADGIAEAKAILSQYGKTVRKDPHIRKKNRYALTLYFVCKPLMRFAYKFTNRWK